MRILNLEDNANDAELNLAMLSARWPDCEFVCATTREEYIEALEKGGFQLILADYTIPDFHGSHALVLARKKRPEVPFIFVSGTIGEDTAIEALKSGATDYVLKHRLMRLIPAVDRALREAEERAECQRAEEAMRQSEHKYRELFENLNEAAFLVDEYTGKIIDTNRCAETLLGCGRGEILGRNQSRFLALDKDQPQSVAHEAPTRRVGAVRCEMTRADKAAFPVEVRDTRLMLYGRALRLRLCHEITESRPA